jgi:hypothetical protein
MLLRAGAAAVGGTAVLATVVGWQVSRAESDCSDATLTLAAAHEIAPTIAAALADNGSEISTPQGCAQVEVVWMDPADAVKAISSGQQAPDLWVPDTSAWLSRLPADLQGRQTWQLAKTPVVLAGPSGAPRPATWLNALSAPGATLLDPRSSGASVGALAALQAEATYGKTTGTDLSRWLVDKAQSAPDYSLDDNDMLTNAANGGDEASGWFPTTEQRVIDRADEGGLGPLEALAPKSGSILLDYPLVAVSGDDNALATAGAEELAQQMASPAVQDRLAAAGFRPASGQPTDAQASVGRITEIGVVQPLAVGNMLHTWVTLSTDSRMLVVLDVSGSMAEYAGASTRVDLAREAMLAALNTMPSRWHVGLWAFSVGLGDKHDYRDLVPVRQLDASADGGTHRDALADEVEGLPILVGGGTALYDTALAAYDEALRGYDPGRLNTVVLMTDGRNEDPNGVRLPKLLDEIERRQDPNRPVQMITIGMGPQADVSALQQIADLTGGQSYVAGDPRDIEEIFNDALLERVGWGLR